MDTVGGNILVTALKSTQFGGSVTCRGMITSNDLKSTIFPFILKGTNLLGVASAESSLETTTKVWQKLNSEWKVDCLKEIDFECSLEALSERIDEMLQGRAKGRVVIDFSA